MSTPQMEITLTDKVQWSGKQMASQIDGEVVLMNIDRGHYYSLDDIGSDIWLQIEQPVPVGTLCQALAQKYSADSATVTTDVLALLNKMHEQELITVVG